MKAKDYIEEVLKIEVPETPVINGQWFAEKGLPMIVACVSCGMTMSLFSADIKTDGTIFCNSCAPPDLEYNEDMIAFEEEFNSDEDLPPCEQNGGECIERDCYLFEECH